MHSGTKEKMIKYKEEIFRKLIHLSSLWIPILYLHCNTAFMLKILFPLTIIAIIIDISRKYIPKLNQLVNLLIGNLMRDDEKSSNSFAGATHLFIASTFTIAFFNKEIAIFALSVLVISDTFAALIGRKFGRIKLASKSLEGSLSFALSAFAIHCYFVNFHNFDLPLTQSLFAIFAATLAELYSKKLRMDDNFAIPLAISIVLAV
jgi:dolichol kinase